MIICSHLNTSYRLNSICPGGSGGKYPPQCLDALPCLLRPGQLPGLMVRTCLELGVHVLPLLGGTALAGVRMGTSFPGDIQGVLVGFLLESGVHHTEFLQCFQSGNLNCKATCICEQFIPLIFVAMFFTSVLQLTLVSDNVGFGIRVV